MMAAGYGTNGSHPAKLPRTEAGVFAEVLYLAKNDYRRPPAETAQSMRASCAP